MSLYYGYGKSYRTDVFMSVFKVSHRRIIQVFLHTIESADKQARDMRDMAIERRLRAGEDLEDIYKKKPTEVHACM